MSRVPGQCPRGQRALCGAWLLLAMTLLSTGRTTASTPAGSSSTAAPTGKDAGAECDPQAAPSIGLSSGGVLQICTGAPGSLLVHGALSSTVPSERERDLEERVTDLEEGYARLQTLVCRMGPPRWPEVNLVTYGARTWKKFDFEERTFLVVANQFSPEGTQQNASSELFEYQHDAEGFLSFQNISTRSARDWEYFEMGERKFLIVANFYSTEASSHDIDSELFEYQPASGERDGSFVSVQNISTYGARDWEYFEIGERKFLVVANQESTMANSSDINSELFEYQSRRGGGQFLSVQNISTHGARDWEYFEIGERKLLIVANFVSTEANSHDIDSELFEYQPASGERDGSFVSVQNISTYGARDWEYFEIGERKFLVVANQKSTLANSSDINSELFEYQSGRGGGQFVSVQNISTFSARDWEYFDINGRHFLVVANPHLADSNTTSELFEYQVYASGDHGPFVSVQNISAENPQDWEYFEIGERKFLAVAGFNTPLVSNSTSHIFEWNGCQF